MKLDIDIAPPDGWEIYGYGKPQPGDQIHSGPGWSLVGGAHTYSPCFLLARRKRTLADWANEQEVFKAFAKIRTSHLGHDTKITYIPDAYSWSFGEAYWNLGTPPTGLDLCPLKLVDGKWEPA